jgi:hypothetical protein
MTVTTKQFASLHDLSIDCECSTGFFTDEFDCDHADAIESFEIVETDEGRLEYTYSVPGASGLGLGYTMKDVTFDEIEKYLKKENLKELWSVLDQKEDPVDTEILDLVKEYGILEEVIQLAFDGWVDGAASGACELTESGELESHSYTGGSYNRDTNIELYRFDQNWMSNNCWDNPNMLVSDEEWCQLKETFCDEADYTNGEQLESIGISLNERLVEYIIFSIENTY